MMSLPIVVETQAFGVVWPAAMARLGRVCVALAHQGQRVTVTLPALVVRLAPSASALDLLAARNGTKAKIPDRRRIGGAGALHPSPVHVAQASCGVLPFTTLNVAGTLWHIETGKK